MIEMELFVFSECALTTFFPRYIFDSQEEMESYFEQDDGGNSIVESRNVKSLFDKAKELAVDIWVGYGERTPNGRHYNTAVYFSGKSGQVLSKYCKVHVPGFKEPPFRRGEVHFEKRYFEFGDLGFQAFRVPTLLPDALQHKWMIEEMRLLEG